MAVKQVRVSDLSGQQAGEDQFAKLIVHEHPQYQGPITLDVLPEEIGELPHSEQYVSVEVIQPGERSGQRALLSVDRFNQLAARGDMNSVLMNAVAEQQPQRPAQPAVLHWNEAWQADAVISTLDQIARANSSNATATRRPSASSTASS